MRRNAQKVRTWYSWANIAMKLLHRTQNWKWKTSQNCSLKCGVELRKKRSKTAKRLQHKTEKGGFVEMDLVSDRIWPVDCTVELAIWYRYDKEKQEYVSPERLAEETNAKKRKNDSLNAAQAAVEKIMTRPKRPRTAYIEFAMQVGKRPGFFGSNDNCYRMIKLAMLGIWLGNKRSTIF